MNENEQVVGELRAALAEGRVRADQVRALIASGQMTSHAPAGHRIFGGLKVSVTSVLSYIGALIVAIGIAVLIGQNWQVLDSLSRILATLGIGVATFVSGTLFMRRPQTFMVGIAFHVIAALTIPTGIAVSFHEYGVNVNDIANQTTISLIVFVLYMCSFILFRHMFFLICLIVSGTWLFLAASALVPAANEFALGWEYGAYRVLVIGLSYLLLAHGLMSTRYAALRGVLFGFGSLGFLGAALSLGGWTPSANLFWETAFPFIIAGMLYLSVRLQQRQLLFWPTLFLMIYILKITSEYFSGSLGWPISLIIAGFALIAVGFLSFQLRRRYFRIS